MRGSSVVLGLKSWVGRIHPQLPLSSKESSRLLKALTSSFREHLDEVHPTTVDRERPRQVATSIQSHSHLREATSSTYSADRHLASILTNPLLDAAFSTQAEKDVRAKTDYEHAKTQLAGESSDPMALFENYRSRGILTIPIMSLCLASFSKSISALTPGNQQRALLRSRPGQRTLAWLWGSGIYQDLSSGDHKSFLNVLVDLLMREQCEELLWEFLKVNLQGNESTSSAASPNTLQRYGWKRIVLARMIVFKLLPPFNSSNSADAALETYFIAQQLPANAHMPDSKQYDSYSPVVFAWSTLVRHLSSGKDWSQTSSEKYQKLYSSPPPRSRPMTDKINLALLHLHDPCSADPQPMLDLIRHAFAPGDDTDYHRLFRQMTAPLSEASGRWWSKTLVRTTKLLDQHDRHNDSKWLRTMIDKLEQDRAAAGEGLGLWSPPSQQTETADDNVKSTSNEDTERHCSTDPRIILPFS